MGDYPEVKKVVDDFCRATKAKKKVMFYVQVLKVCPACKSRHWKVKK